MSLWSRIKKTYTKIDSKVGGVLPGGAPKSSTTTQQQVSSSKTSSSSNPIYKNINTQPNPVVQRLISGGGGSSSSSSGGSSSRGGGGSSSSSSGGMSRINEQTGQGQYVLSSGQVVDATEQNRQAIVSGKSDAQIIALNNRNKAQSVSFGQTIEEQTKNPLGSPTVQDNRGFLKKGYDYVSDKISGQTGGVWLQHFSRPTGMSADEIKTEFKESSSKGLKNTILLGVPGIIGFTPEGKFKTAWSKSPEQRTDLSQIGQTSGLSNVQAEWGKSAEKIRESGRVTTEIQKEQSKSIEQTSRQIADLTKSYTGEGFTSKEQVDLMFGKKDLGWSYRVTNQDKVDLLFGKKKAYDIDLNKKNAPGFKAKQFEKDADLYQKEVESFNLKAETYQKEVDNFNKLYGGQKLEPEVYKTAIDEKQRLNKIYQETLKDQERLNLNQKTLEQNQINLNVAYNEYQSNVAKKVGDLRKVGVSTNLDKEGNINFSSKELETVVAPVGFKLEKSFMKDGKLTWKNYAYGGGSVVHTTAEAVAVGYVTGGTGVLAKVSSGVSKLPKVAQYVFQGTALTLAVGGVASKGYSGYKYAKLTEVPGWYGATLGTTTGLGQVGGFAVGGYYGTKAYYSRLENKIVSGKTTNSVAETREGKIFVDEKGNVRGGTAEQKGIYETKVKGTDIKIKSGVRIKGTYGKDAGQSDVRITSQLTGKDAKGLPKSYVTEAKTLESGDYIKLRAYTKSTTGKNWYEQDYLIKRTMIDRLKVDVSKSSTFKGYTEAERLKFLSQIKAVGSPKNVGKKLPTNVWKTDELIRFSTYKGQGKVMQPWESTEARADSIFGTKQIVLYKDTKPFTIKIDGLEVSSTKLGAKQFQSLAETKGLSAEILKTQIKDSLIQVQKVVSTPMNKKGSLALTFQQPKTMNVPQLYKGLVQPQTTSFNANTLFKVQLKNIVPGLLQKQFTSQIPTSLALSGGLVGATQVLETRQSLATFNEQAFFKKLSQVQVANTLNAQVPLQRVKQISQTRTVQTTTPALETALVSPTINSPIFTPPTITGIPIIPGLPNMDLNGWGYREPKQTLFGKRTSAYIPDFTAKALGLKPKELSKAQLKKLLKTDLTGLEVRRGVVVK